jgi:dTMP kinase
VIHPIPGGFLAVIEGIDGAGKSSVLARLADCCRERSLPFIVSREPTNGPWGRQLRESARNGRLRLEDELALFVKDRAEHVEQLIRPALAEGKVVLLDRYYFSTAAYQGARGADPAAILAENERFAPAPDLVLLLDLPPATALARVCARGDAPDEFEREAALRAVREIFLSLRHPALVRVDADRPAAAVAGECAALLADAMDRKRALS